MTVSEAVLVTLAYDAEMVAGVGAVTALVLTVNVALLAPPATVTLAGTVAVDVLLERETAAPPVSAGPLSVKIGRAACRARVQIGGVGGAEKVEGTAGDRTGNGGDV